jgi:drug/metabolite transporter (DMT)-like permease
VSEFIFLLFFVVVFGTVGEIFVSRAMKETGEVKNFRPRALVEVILRAMRVKWMWLGVGMMTLAFFSLLAVFSVANVSFVVPVTALSYVVGAVGGRFFLGERVNLQRWIGILLVCVGVTLVLFGRT